MKPFTESTAVFIVVAASSTKLLKVLVKTDVVI
jgi:hypothetical protein